MSINCKGKLIEFSTPKVMGILNLTPDSFYAESRKQEEKQLLSAAEKMLNDGASFIDIGGYSSRPGAKNISESEELQRVLPALKSILKHFPEALISIDTFRAEVAKHALENGAGMINDISAGRLDTAMLPVIAKFQVPYIMMHMRGNPQNMAKQNKYENLVQEIVFYFSQRIQAAREVGINDLIIDPGFGFSKNSTQNFELLSRLQLFKNMQLPLLAGISRKSTIYKTLGISPQESLNGTTVLNTLCLQNGASILRVHDVKEAMQCVKLLSLIPS